MEYYIDPKVFYYIDLLTKLEYITLAIGILSVIAFIIILFLKYDFEESSGNRESEHYTEIHNKYLKLQKITLILTIISMLIFIICPQKETMTEMLIAKTLNKENVKEINDSIVDDIKQIIDAVDESDDDSFD